MRHSILILLLLALAGCGSTISPNDPQYARSGAPRVGEPVPSAQNSYGRIMGPDSQGAR